MLGLEGVLTWRVAGETLYVDFSAVPYREMPCDWAWTIRIEDYLRSR